MNNYIHRICGGGTLLLGLAYTSRHSRQIKPLSAKILSCSCRTNHQYLSLHFRPKLKGISVGPSTQLFSSKQSLSVTSFIRTYGNHSEHDKTEKTITEHREEVKKLSLLQRFRQMYRDYWYVLLPVHLATSAVWVAGFYYLATSGVDVVALLQSMGASEKIIGLLKDSSTGYVAITYALYKIATPARYTVTLGGTTITINYLKQWGYIKPIPPKEKLKEMYQERRDNLKDNLKEKKENFFKTYQKKD